MKRTIHASYRRPSPADIYETARVLLDDLWDMDEAEFNEITGNCPNITEDLDFLVRDAKQAAEGGEY